MPLYGPSLISSDNDQQQFVEKYSVTAVVIRSLILAVMCDETVLRPFFQCALANTILLLPWDPGLPLSGMGTKLSTFVHELTVRLTSASEVTCLQGSSIHEQSGNSVVLETVVNGMVALVEQQPWLSCEKSLFVVAVVRAPIDNYHSIVVTLRILDVLTCGVLLVQSYSRMVQVITCCPRKQHSCRNFGIPSVDDTILNKYTYSSNWRLLNVSCLQASIGSSFIGYSSLSGCELLHWKISWPLDLVCSASGNKSDPIFHPTQVRFEDYLAKGNTALQPFSTRTAQVSFLFLAYVAMWSFCNLESCQGQLSWDPGIWTLLCSFGFLTQAEAKGKRNVAAPTYYCDHYLDQYCFDKACDDQDAYLGVFRQQVGAICYFNLVKVCLDYDTHLDLGEVMKPQVPWDPGGSTRHRLEVKPKFKEGGMLATSPTISTGLGLCYAVGLGLLGRHGSDYKYQRKGYGRLGLERMASASSAFGLLLPSLFLSSSSSSSVMA